jgi:phage regulator Rha-like protein
MELTIIQKKIYEIRDQRIMLDFDLAEMYGTETSQLKRAVRRNLERFDGDDFMFELTREELSRCQIGTLNKGRGSNIKYLPFAFTELGVSMLSSVLNSKTAIEINRNIMRAFVAMRTHLLTQSSISAEIKELWRHMKTIEEQSEENLKALNDMGEENQVAFDEIYLALSELANKQKNNEHSSNSSQNPIGFRKPETHL